MFDSLRAANPSSGGPPGGGGSLALALGGWGCLAGGTVLGKLSVYCEKVRMLLKSLQNPFRTSTPRYVGSAIRGSG